MTQKILLVDDEADNRVVIRDVLEKGGFAVIAVGDAESALSAAVDRRPDMVLADVVMPAINGVALCRRLRSERRTAALPIILMSAMRRGELEQAEGIEIGADDYLVKPVAPRLLLAKISAVLRRRPEDPAPRETPVRAGSLLIDPAGRVATVGRKQLPLTRKEFDLLALLVEKRGRVLGTPYLLETIWGYDTAVYKDHHTIEVHVSSLRRKLGPGLSRRIVTVPGLGYRFEKNLN